MTDCIYNFLVVDDHPIFRQGLVTLICSNPKYNVSAEAGSVTEAMDCLEKNIPDIALVDISLGEQNGMDLVLHIKNNYPNVYVLVISMHDELLYVERVLEVGARGYIMKQEASSRILTAIETVLSGKIYVSDVMKNRLLESVFDHQKENQSFMNLKGLSNREFAVLQYIGQGYSVSEISQVLNLSVKTVNTYRDHIKEKLNYRV